MRILAVLLLLPSVASATSYTITNTFTAGTTAVASQVNANFSGAKTAIDENSLRIDSLLNSNTCNSGPCDLTAATTIGGSLALIASHLGVTVQAYDADLADLADGSLSGSKIGTGLDAATITTGTIASTARLPSAVIEQSEIQTTAQINALTVDDDFLTSNGTYNMAVTGTATFSGTLNGATRVSPVSAAAESPSDIFMKGDLRIYTNPGAVDVTLPSISAAGLNICFYMSTAFVLTLDASSTVTGDTIYLNGVSVGQSDAIDSAGAAGDFICLLSTDVNTWITLGRSGTWVDGGPD